MADTKCQRDCEAWIREHWLREHFGETFEEKAVLLSTGGRFKFDGVNADESILVTISTSSRRTTSGNLATGAVNKLRSDMLFHTLAPPKRSVIVLSERDMHESWLEQRNLGRVPAEVEFLLASLPQELACSLVAAKRRASEESRNVTRDPGS